MKFKAKLRRIGNSLGVIIPRNVITDLKENNEIELDVITNNQKVITKDVSKVITTKQVITKPKKTFDTTWCKKHDVMKGSCKCL